MIIPFDGFYLDLLESQFLQYGKSSSRALYDVYVESVPSYYVEYVSKVYGDPEFPEELWDARMELESLGLTSL